jgi:hypothetical protein
MKHILSDLPEKNWNICLLFPNNFCKDQNIFIECPIKEEYICIS